jgi:penicillin V acylase-like amidase (Ntn superfamily)
VEEVKKAISGIVVWGNLYKPWGMVCKLHFVIHDAKGKTLIIEWIDRKVKLYENHDNFSVLTNSPDYELQLKNALSHEVSTNDITNSKARFKFLYNLLKEYHSANQQSKDYLVPVSKIIGRAVTVKGEDKEAEGKYFSTQFIILRDHAKKNYYIKFQDDLNFRKINLNENDLSGESPTVL